MTLRNSVFNSLADLTVFVNGQGIAQADIQAVLCDTSGQFILLYWGT